MCRGVRGVGGVVCGDVNGRACTTASPCKEVEMHARAMDVVAVAVLGCCMAGVLLLGLCCFAGAVERHGFEADEKEVEK